jgi:hypothetical protein
MVSGANLVSVQYLIPKGKQKIYTISDLCFTGVKTCVKFVISTSYWNVWSVYWKYSGRDCRLFIQLVYVKHNLDLKYYFTNLPVFNNVWIDYVFCTCIYYKIF